MEATFFAHGLGRCDCVTGMMWKNKPPLFRLCVNEAASEEITWHCQHYTDRSVSQNYASGVDLPANSMIVVGGDLAGVSAANPVVELGGMTVLLDMFSSFCGGTSAHANIGMNGAGTANWTETGCRTPLRSSLATL